MRILLIALAMTVALTASLMAGTIPYSSAGSVAPTVMFTASGGAVKIAYFYAVDAAYDSEIRMWVNGIASPNGFGLPNHSSYHGEPFELGYANPGDALTFELKVYKIQHSWFSDPSWNSP